MKKLLAIAVVVASMIGCAVPEAPRTAAQSEAGAANAAALGYHGPVHRLNSPPGN